nr:MAG TPA: putative DnaG-like primase [Caudoviricetes sp.]
METFEWLQEAQKLPLNGQSRIYHGAERRPNLVVRNLPDKWTAYCFSCKEYSEVRKDYVRIEQEQAVLQNTVQPTALELTDPRVPLHSIVYFLHTKHMSLSLINDWNPQWDPRRKRLTIDLPDGRIGRDIYGYNPAKWYLYWNSVQYGSASGTNEITRDHVILTEDMFSAIKAQKYLPDTQCIALLGTTLQKGLERALLRRRPRMVHCMLDGDEAGLRGSYGVLRRLRLLGIPCVMQNPEKDDPKDQSREWFITKIKEAT